MLESDGIQNVLSQVVTHFFAACQGFKYQYFLKPCDMHLSVYLPFKTAFYLISLIELINNR